MHTTKVCVHPKTVWGTLYVCWTHAYQYGVLTAFTLLEMLFNKNLAAGIYSHFSKLITITPNVHQILQCLAHSRLCRGSDFHLFRRGATLQKCFFFFADLFCILQAYRIHVCRPFSCGNRFFTKTTLCHLLLSLWSLFLNVNIGEYTAQLLV